MNPGQDTNDTTRQQLEAVAQQVADESVLDLAHAVEGDDVRVALLALKALNRWLAAVEGHLVQDARIEGLSWDEVGQLLGRSRQAVWKKHADPGESAAS